MPNKAKTIKINPFIRVLSLMLALILSIQFNTPLQIVQASGVNAYNGTTGGYAEPAYLPYAGSEGRCGIVFYVADKNGKQYEVKGKKIPPIVFMDTSQEDKKRDLTLQTTRCEYISIPDSAIKEYPTQKIGSGKLPKPIEWNGESWTGNGAAIGEYLLEKSGLKTAYGVDICNWEVLLKTYGGDGWKDVVDALHDGVGIENNKQEMTLCIETMAINYIYYKPMQVKITPYTKTGWYYYTHTRTITTDSKGNKQWSDTTTLADTTFYTGGETSGGEATAYPSADGAYYLPTYISGHPEVYFGTQSALAGFGNTAEKTDLNTLATVENLSQMRTDVNDPSTAFDTTVLRDEATQQPSESAWWVSTAYNYGTKTVDGKTVAVTEEEAKKNTGSFYSCIQTKTRTITYNKATVEQAPIESPVGDHIANYKWMQIVLPYSLCLKEDQLGISKPAIGDTETPVDFGNLIVSSRNGYGISMFDDQLIKAEINTYDGIYSPGNTEDPHENKKGHNYVVKAYMTITKDQNGNIISEEPSGLYERKTKGDLADTVCNIINVNDEPKGFKLKNWWISDTYAQTTEPQIYKKDIPGSVRDSGTSPTQVQLKGTEENGGECLYLLLVKVITKTIEDKSDTIKIQLEQSEITKNDIVNIG